MAVRRSPGVSSWMLRERAGAVLQVTRLLIVLIAGRAGENLRVLGLSCVRA